MLCCSGVLSIVFVWVVGWCLLCVCSYKYVCVCVLWYVWCWYCVVLCTRVWVGRIWVCFVLLYGMVMLDCVCFFCVMLLLCVGVLLHADVRCYLSSSSDVMCDGDCVARVCVWCVFLCICVRDAM